MLTEINIDAVVGPTHHFGGLGVGNVASQEHAFRASNPRAAALQGLSKAALLASLGIPQFVFLPPQRPRWEMLSALGFGGSRSEQLQAALEQAPQVLSAAFSSAFMWAANSATVSAASDCADNQTHLTVANLISSWHRAAEANERLEDLKNLFADCPQTTVHPKLPAIVPLRDEGAANHIRLCDASGVLGFNLMVFGIDDSGEAADTRFLPRQTRAAFEAIVRQHRLLPDRVYFLQQHPDAIAAGVFHNDVIAMGHQNILLHHSQAFWDAEQTSRKLERDFAERTGERLVRIEISDQQLPLADAVASYFFNSQIVSPPLANRNSGPRMVLISPIQCQQVPTARRLIDQLLADNAVPIDDVRYVDLGQSMAGGGGPACLRLRVPLASEQIDRLSSDFRLTEELHEKLVKKIAESYPETLQLSLLSNLDVATSLEAIPGELHRLVCDRPI